MDFCVLISNIFTFLISPNWPKYPNFTLELARSLDLKVNQSKYGFSGRSFRITSVLMWHWFKPRILNLHSGKKGFIYSENWTKYYWSRGFLGRWFRIIIPSNFSSDPDLSLKIQILLARNKNLNIWHRSEGEATCWNIQRTTNILIASIPFEF